MPRRDFHFVFGLRAQTAPLHVLHYLCLASCFATQAPDAVHLHYRHEPFGPYWERVKSRLVLHRIDAPVAGFAPERYAAHAEGRLIAAQGWDYAHEADFLRLDLLLREGGCYADMDTLFLRRYPDAWFEPEFVIGEEASPLVPGQPLQPSLCNAVMLARPGSAFARRWRERMGEAFDGRWSAHSCSEAGRLWRALPAALQVLPSAYFYRYGASAAGLRSLLEEADAPREDLYSVHLWAHLWWSAARTDFSAVHADAIDEAWLRGTHCTLARLAHPFLDV
jgi:hypothetical protein